MAEVIEKTVTTKHIKNCLENFAHEQLLDMNECEFKLQKSETYVKKNPADEYSLYSDTIVKEYADKERILNEHIEFEQQYTVTLKRVEKCSLHLKYTLKFDTHSAQPYIILSPNSNISHKLYTPKQLLNLLYKELNKIKVYNQILIRIFDDTMIKSLKLLIKYIYAGKFKKNVKIPLFNGIVPVVTRESRLIFWYEEKMDENQVIEVEKNELLIEFKKPIFGKDGFNAFGKSIDSTYANNAEDLETEIDEESIYIQEDSNSKRYLSKKQGFVNFTSNKLSVDNKIKLRKISRNAKNIASSEENSIEVTIAQHDTNRDSVGEGVALTSETIHIEGFVGANSSLEATNLEIKGATHQDSIQFAKFAKINRHKGKLRAHQANITLLEGGEVHASYVNIETCLGGSIYAKDVIIEHVKSNLKIFASNSISIKLVSGEDNKFKIHYKDIPIIISELEFIENDIEDLKYLLEEALRHDNSKVENIKKEIKNLKSQKKKLKLSYTTAKIDIKNPLRGLNHILFTIDSQNELHFKTGEEKYSPFYLEINENKITLLPVNKSITLEK